MNFTIRSRCECQHENTRMGLSISKFLLRSRLPLLPKEKKISYHNTGSDTRSTHLINICYSSVKCKSNFIEYFDIIKTIDGGQQDALLRRANIKKLAFRRLPFWRQRRWRFYVKIAPPPPQMTFYHIAEKLIFIIFTDLTCLALSYWRLDTVRSNCPKTVHFFQLLSLSEVMFRNFIQTMTFLCLKLTFLSNRRIFPKINPHYFPVRLF